MSKLVRESISFERGGDPRRSMKVGKLERIKEKYGKENLNNLLIDAFLSNNLADIKFLEKQGADWNHMELAALVGASIRGYLDIVKYLVEQKEVDLNFNGDQAFREAAENGHLDVVKYLVEKGVDVHTNDDYALRYAAENGHLDVVKYIIEQVPNIDEWSLNQALQYASEQERQDVVNYLKFKV